MIKSRSFARAVLASAVAFAAGCQCISVGTAGTPVAQTATAGAPQPSTAERFTLAGVAQYHGAALANAAVTVYRLGDATALGSVRTNADGSFAAGVSGKPGDVLEVVAYEGGHVLDALAFPQSDATDASTYGRVAVTENTAIIVGALADSYSDLGVLLENRDHALTRDAIAKAKAVADAFVAKHDGALLATLATQAKDPLPAAGPDGPVMPSYVQALKDHVRTVKDSLQVGTPTYRVQATGDHSSAQDLVLIYSYLDETYLGLYASMAAATGSEPNPTDLPRLSTDGLAQVEAEIRAAKGDQAKAQGSNGVSRAVIVFFIDLEGDDLVIKGLQLIVRGIPGLKPEPTPVPTPKATPTPKPTPTATPTTIPSGYNGAGGGGSGGGGAAIEETASGSVNVHEGTLAAPSDQPGLDY